MPKNPFAAVEKRYKFRMPELYLELFAGGHFDPRNEADWLTLSDFEWLTPEAMAEFVFLDWQVPYKTWFVPFAISGRGDQWGWRLDWAEGDDPPVVFCEWGPEGYGYAPNFQGFLYRMLLEELSATWLLENAEDEKGKQTFGHSLEIILPHLPEAWAARLKKLAKKPWQKNELGTIYVYPRTQCVKIVAKELAFPHLNEKFWQEEPPKPKEAEPATKIKKTTKGTKSTKKTGGKTKAPFVGDYAGTAAGQSRNDNELEMAFCWCPGGTFQMGSPVNEPQRDEDEGPVQVTLTRGFWLGKFPVTQGEFEALTGELKGTFTSVGYQKAAVAGIDTSRFPVERITWVEATEFCQQLTKQERKAGRLPKNWEYRLPTEAQWEYACRSGTTTATAFGDKLSSKQANFNGSQPYNNAAKGPNLQRPSAVGSYPANAWGLHDMHGNVREFCRDVGRVPLPGGTDPEVVPDKKTLMRSVRGGSWRDEGHQCRSAFRYGILRTVFDDVLGFRIACVQV